MFQVVPYSVLYMSRNGEYRLIVHLNFWTFVWDYLYSTLKTTNKSCTTEIHVDLMQGRNIKCDMSTNRKNNLLKIDELLSPVTCFHLTTRWVVRWSVDSNSQRWMTMPRWHRKLHRCSISDSERYLFWVNSIMTESEISIYAARKNNLISVTRDKWP